jgi:hypothetical protein
MIKLKKCSKCNEDKELICFYKNPKSKDGFRSSCITCGKQYKFDNEIKIKEQIKKYNKKRSLSKKEWSEKNKDKVNESRKNWVKKNLEREKQRKKEYSKKYYVNNKKKRLEYSKEKQKEYRKNNPLFKLKCNLRKRIGFFIKKKSISTELILGISFEEFKKYFELKFTEGMSWDKMGKEIHIDHIIPLSLAKNEDEIIKLCHYTNLQPLWAKDNLSKGSKINSK